MQALLVRERTQTEFKCRFKSNLEKWITVPDVIIYRFWKIKFAQLHSDCDDNQHRKCVDRQKLLDIHNPHLIKWIVVFFKSNTK